MRLLIDMDGVTADLLGPWLDWINREFGNTQLNQEMMRKNGVNPGKLGKFKRSDITNWDMAKSTGLGPDVYKFFSVPNMFASLKPLPDAVDVLQALKQQGHEIHYVTACDKGHEDKIAWVRQWTPFIPSTHINFVQEKHIVGGDVIFDDKPSTIELASSEYFLNSKNPKPVIMGCPYNQRVTSNSTFRVWRVTNWHQFFGLIKAWS